MTKLILAVLAGGFLAAGVMLLVIPFPHTISILRDNTGEITADGPPPKVIYYMQGYEIDCGAALMGGPDEWDESGRFVTEPCVEPIRNRRIAGGIALTLGVVALIAAIRIERRSTRQEEPVRDSAPGSAAV